MTGGKRQAAVVKVTSLPCEVEWYLNPMSVVTMSIHCPLRVCLHLCTRRSVVHICAGVCVHLTGD